MVKRENHPDQVMEIYSETVFSGIKRFSSKLVHHSLQSGITGCAVILFFLLVGGCAVQKPISDDTKFIVWEERKNNLQQIHYWNLSGRIAVQFEKESGSASLKWKQRGGDYVIRIIGPLGRGSLELEGGPQGVTMRDANNQLREASDPETLLLDYLGWQIPLSGLKHWILGLPDPLEDIQTLVLDEQARISELSQAGWHVSIRRYQQTDELSLPTKLELRNQKLIVKLVIKKWELSP